jgi:hypothetical protein
MSSSKEVGSSSVSIVDFIIRLLEQSGHRSPMASQVLVLKQERGADQSRREKEDVRRV